MDIDHDKVRAELAASMRAHEDARQARLQRDPIRARAMLAGAAEWRLLAHTRDPEHTAPAWQDEQRFSPTGRDTHAEMVAFYLAQGVWNG